MPQRMAAASLSHRLRSLLRRIGEQLNWSVRVPLLFVLSVRNWMPYFNGASDTSDVTYRLRAGYALTVPAGTTNVNPYIDVWLNHVYDAPDIRWRSVRTILDIGAHIGAFSLYAAKKSPNARIIACEPDPVTYAYLAKNVEQNRLGGRVKAIQSAVAGMEGQATLHVLPGRSEANSMYRSLQGSHDVSVAVSTLQAVFDAEKIDRCDLLKMNAEGVEYEILYGLPPAYLRRIDAIVMNFHLFVEQPRATPDELRSYLEANGFLVTEQGKRIFVAVRR